MGKFWGLDIGSACIKYACVGGKPSAPRLLTSGVIPITAEPMKLEGEERLAAVSSALDELIMHEPGIRRARLAVSLSGFMTRTQIIPLGRMQKKDLYALLESEALALVPAHTAEAFVYATALLPEVDRERRGVVCVTRRQDLEGLCTVMCERGLKPDKAILGPLAYRYLPACECLDDTRLSVLVHVGAKHTNIVSLRGRTLLSVRNIPNGTAGAHRTARRKCHLENNVALQLFDAWLHEAVTPKVPESPMLQGVASWDVEMEEISLPDFSDAASDPDAPSGPLDLAPLDAPWEAPAPTPEVKKAQEATDYFAKEIRHICHEVTRSIASVRDEEQCFSLPVDVLCTGILSESPNLFQIAQEHIRADRIEHLDTGWGFGDTEVTSHQCIAIGLALAAQMNDPDEINLLPATYRPRRGETLKTFMTVGAACLLAALPIPDLQMQQREVEVARIRQDMAKQRLDARQQELELEAGLAMTTEALSKKVASLRKMKTSWQMPLAVIMALNEMGKDAIWIRDITLKEHAPERPKPVMMWGMPSPEEAPATEEITAPPLKQDALRMTVTVEAEAYTSIEHFVDLLKESGWAKDVILKTADSQKETSRDADAFSVQDIDKKIPESVEGKQVVATIQFSLS